MLVPLRRTAALAPALFFVAPSEARVAALHGLVARIEADNEIYALLPPIIDGFETYEPAELLRAIVEIYIKAIREVQPEGPYLLGGNSASGVIVCEVAAQLRTSGESVAGLLLLDPMEELTGLDGADADAAGA